MLSAANGGPIVSPGVVKGTGQSAATSAPRQQQRKPACLSHTDFVGHCSTVNATAVTASQNFSDWLMTNHHRVLASEPLRRHGATTPSPHNQGSGTTHKAATSLLEATADAIRSIRLSVEWSSAFTLETTRGDPLADTPSPQGATGEAILVRVYGVGGLKRCATEAKKGTGWDLGDFTLDSADPVTREALLQTLTEVPLTYTVPEPHSIGGSGGGGAALRETRATLTDFLRDGLAAYMDPEAQRQLPKSSEPLPQQFLANVRWLLDKRRSGASGQSVLDCLRSPTADIAKVAAGAKVPPWKRTAYEVPSVWCAYGWRLWVTVCEQVAAPVLRGRAFSDALVLWCVDGLMASGTLPASCALSDEEQILLRHLVAYMNHRFDLSDPQNRIGGPSPLVRELQRTPTAAHSHLVTVLEMAGVSTQKLREEMKWDDAAAAVGAQTANNDNPPNLTSPTTTTAVNAEMCSRVYGETMRCRQTVVGDSVETLRLKARTLLTDTAKTFAATGFPASATSSPSVTSKDKAITLSRTPAAFEHSILRALTYYASAPTPPTPSWLAEQRALLPWYVNAMTELQRQSSRAGCAWHSAEGARCAEAIILLVLSLLASQRMRADYPSLRAYTLVPAQDVCEYLFEVALVLGTALKSCTLLLRDILRKEEYDRANVLHYIDQAMNDLAAQPDMATMLHEKTEVWENWASKAARKSYDRFVDASNHCADLSEELEEYLDVRRNDPLALGRPSSLYEREIQALRSSIGQIKSRSFAGYYVPFRNNAQKMAWFLPANFTTLVQYGQTALEYLTGETSLLPCDNTCSLHASFKLRASRPGCFAHCSTPAWLHLYDNTPFWQTTPFSKLSVNKDESQFIWYPADVPLCTMLPEEEELEFEYEKFIVEADQLPIPKPLLTLGPYTTPTAQQKARRFYSLFMQSHPSLFLAQEERSSRENESYCTPLLNNSLSRQEWVQLYSIRSHAQTQVSRLLVALRGKCARAVELFETDFIVQHYLVTLLCDVQAFDEPDAQAAMAQLPVLEEDIPTCTARHTPLLLFLCAVYAMCEDAARRRDVLVACARRALALAQELRLRCERASVRSDAEDDAGAAMHKDYCAMYRVASIGLACVGFAPLEVACGDAAFREPVLPVVVSLVLHRGLAREMSGRACSSAYDSLTTAGVYALQRMMPLAGREVQHGALSVALASAYSRIFDDGAAVSWHCVDESALTAHGRFGTPAQTCAVDLASGTLLIDGKTVGGLPGSVLQGALYKTLFGAGTQMQAYPMRQPAWYMSAAASVLCRDHPDERTHFVFSEFGDVGLVVRGAGYALAALMSPVPVHADIGAERHFHFVGCYVPEGSGGESLDVVLFKPMPPGGEGTAVPWLSWHEGRCAVHYIAARAAGADVSAPFTVHAVPYSQRTGALSPRLSERLAGWETVVTSPAQLASLARLFPSSLVTARELLVTVPPVLGQRDAAAVVTVAVPRMGQSFALTAAAVRTRRGYCLADPEGTVPWLRAPPRSAGGGGGGAPFLLLCKDRSACAASPADAMQPAEVAMWPAPAGAAGGAAWTVTEVWRHPHFRYLQTRNTAERLRLCALLLAHYPASFRLSAAPADGDLTVLEEVCGLLRACVSNRPWSVHEREALAALREATGRVACFDDRAVLLVWLERLSVVRGEAEVLTVATDGVTRWEGEESAAAPELQPLVRHAEDHVRLLLMRRLLSHRCVPPPELLLGSSLEHVHPPPPAPPEWRGGGAAALQTLADAVAAVARRVEATLALRGAWVRQLEQGLAGARAVEGAVRDALAALDRERAVLPAALADPRVCGSGVLGRACRAHPLATLTLQEAGHMAVCGVERWLEEVAPWDAAGSVGWCAGWLPDAGAADLLAAACRTHTEACVVRDWLERVAVLLGGGGVCVAHDWLQRVVQNWTERVAVLLGGGGSSTAAAVPANRVEVAVTELGSPREDVRAHPAWMVFEAEQRVAIRFVQYATWQAMWDGVKGDVAASTGTPGLVTQLNMGEGKTRVVIPMLLLSEMERAVRTGDGGSAIPCVHVLSAVAEELRRHLQESLGTPGLRFRVLHKPFARSVPATPEVLRALVGSFRRFPRAVLVEQREHYVSYMQKREEVLLERCGCSDSDGLEAAATAAERVRRAVASTAPDAAAVRGVLLPTPAQLLGPDALHVFDEADELLSCRYNLVYAVGAEARLEDRELRCAVAERLLACCAQLIVAFPECFEFTGAAADAAAVGVVQVEYPVCYAKHSADMAAFCDEVLRYFLQVPPPLCAWMARLPAAVRHLVTTPVDLTPGSFDVLGSPQPDMVAQVMCLRGFFQHGLLRFVLGHRANVSFGVPPAWRATKMAVPYDAADVPSERSEFAQPDVALTLTYVAYMQRGLTLGEFRQALDLLLHLPDAQRDGEYEKWCAAGEDVSVEEQQLRLGEGVPLLAVMVDAQDGAMVAAMHAALRRRMAVVAFWVFHFVLETEGRYHSHMLRATAWDVAAQRRMVGFSGTKDGCALLPVALAFRDHPDERIAGSTERMSRLVERHSGAAIRRLSDGGGGGSQAEQLVRCAIGVCGCDVLIDVGALLAGASPRVVARFACAQLEATRTVSARCRGVCFFDYVDARCWCVMDVATQQVLPVETAALTPAECFVVYDQARCRGADLRLREDAAALVSLARGTQRDALLQAVGRLRAFGRGQRTLFVAPASVAEEIERVGVRDGAAAAASLPARVLRWAEGNTSEALTHAVPEYVGAAAHHLAKAALPATGVRAVRTPTGCFALYAPGYGKVPCDEFTAAALARFAGTDEAALVKRNLSALVGDTPVPTAAANTTTERELQQEAEQEKEKEVEVEEAPAMAFQEPYLLNPDNAATQEVHSWCAKVLPVASFASMRDVELHFSPHFHHIRNLLDGTTPSEEFRSALPPLRQVGFVLCCPSGRRMVLLTQYQAAGVLHRERGRAFIDYSHPPFAFLATAPPAGSPEERELKKFVRETADAVAVFAHFFNGETHFTERQRGALRSLL